MPASYNTKMTDSGGGGNKPKSPYVPEYINYKYYQQQSAEQQRLAAQQAEAARRARMIAEAQQRAQQQAALAAQQAQLQRERWAALYQQNQSNLSMEPVAPTWRSPVAQQPAPSLQNTLSMEPVAPTITYKPHNPFSNPTANAYGVPEPVNTTDKRAPWQFSFGYNMPTLSTVAPPAYWAAVDQGMVTNKPLSQQQNISIRQTVSPTTVPTANAPQRWNGATNYFSDYWNSMMNRRDAYGNLVPTGPINEYWEFTDIPETGYGGYGGYGGWGSGGYEQEDSAPFYRGDYTQNKSRWNETLLTWGLRQE